MSRKAILGAAVAAFVAVGGASASAALAVTINTSTVVKLAGPGTQIPPGLDSETVQSGQTVTIGSRTVSTNAVTIGNVNVPAGTRATVGSVTYSYTGPGGSNGVIAANVPVANGDASTTFTPITTGAYVITAQYNGATFGNTNQHNTTNSSDTADLRVTRATTNIVASAKLSPGQLGGRVHLSAVLTRDDNGNGIAGERVVFRDSDGVRLCAATTNPGGVATCSIRSIDYSEDLDAPLGRFVAQFRRTATLRGSSDGARAPQPN